MLQGVQRCLSLLGCIPGGFSSLRSSEEEPGHRFHHCAGASCQDQRQDQQAL